MTLLVVLLGAMFGVGVFGLARFVVGSPDTDAPGAEPAESQKSSQHRSFGDRFDRLGLRLGLGATAAVAVGVLTGWPVGVLLAAASAFFAPSLLGGRARRGEQQARLEAIATWTESHSACQTSGRFQATANQRSVRPGGGKVKLRSSVVSA